MISTFFTFLTTVLVVTIVVVIVNIWISKSSYELSFSSRPLLFILLIPFIRMILPVEFSFTKVIRSYEIYPAVYSVLFEPRTQLNFSIIQILIAIWLIGCGISIVRKLRQYHKVSFCFNHLPNCADADTQAFISDYLKTNKTRNVPIKVIQSPHIVEPIIYGITKPTIVVPEIIFKCEVDLRNVLLHELNHYIHGDLLFKWVLEFVCSLYWFILPIHTLKKHIYGLMEVRADYNALRNKSSQDKIDYLNTLLGTCQNVQKGKAYTHLIIASFTYGNTVIIKRRFNAIANLGKNRKINYRNIFILSLILILALTIPYFFVIQPYSQLPEDAQDTFSFSDGNYYLKHKDGGGYEIYLDGTLLGYAEHLEDDMKGLPIVSQ